MLPKLPDPALLDSLVGNYSVDSAGGGAAGGILSLVRKGTFLHAQGARVGLAMPWAGRLVIVWGPLNRTEIGAYEIKGASVTGLWVPPGADQADYSACGLELSDVDAKDPSIWRISRAYAIDKSAYAGKIERSAMLGTAANASPKPVQMLWRLEDGEFRSFGLDFGAAVYATFCLEPESPFGLGVYDLKTLQGTALTSDGLGATAETLRRV